MGEMSKRKDTKTHTNTHPHARNQLSADRWPKQKERTKTKIESVRNFLVSSCSGCSNGSYIKLGENNGYTQIYDIVPISLLEIFFRSDDVSLRFILLGYFLVDVFFVFVFGSECHTVHCTYRN